MSLIIEIHEFSTGIQVDGTPENWVSLGFTGNYINSTIESVPTLVQNAIASKYFAVAEGASTDEPAVIGRELKSQDHEYSVVAVVKKGRDEMGRSAPLYRYFLCFGLGYTDAILHWMKEKKTSFPVFDPFDNQTIGKPHEYQVNSSPPIPVRQELSNLLEKSSLPIIVPAQEICFPLILNEMAKQIGSPVAWAFNVRAIVKPKEFQIIKPADYESEESINYVIANSPNRPRSIIEEEQIKTAIKGLISRDSIKEEHIISLENALKNPEIDQNYWKFLFEEQGAKDAIFKDIYTPQNVRLLTLKAIVIPEFLTDFLSWIQQKKDKQVHHDTSHRFQNQILKYINQNKYKYPGLINKLINGTRYIIPQLIKKPEILDSVVWLLNDKTGIWGCLYKGNVIKEIDHTLKSMTRKSSTSEKNQVYRLQEHSEWKSIFDNLSFYWQPNAKKYLLKEYQPIAGFFKRMNSINEKNKINSRELEFFALFDYITIGQIPKTTFNKLKSLGYPKNPYFINIYGIWLKRKVSWTEKTRSYLGKMIAFCWRANLKLPLAVVLMFLSLLGGVALERTLLSSKAKSISDLPKANPEIGTNLPPTESDKSNPYSSQDNSQSSHQEIGKEKLKKAMDDFYKTKTVLYYMAKDLESNINDDTTKTKKVDQAIVKTLDPNNKFKLSMNTIRGDFKQIDDQTKESWTRAIYSYQNRKNVDQIVGFLIKDGDTNQTLKNDVKEKIKSLNVHQGQ